MAASPRDAELGEARTGSLAERFTATERVIYRGLASTIFLGVERCTLLQVGIKVVLKARLDTEQERAQARAEAELHASVPPHANVARLLAAAETDAAILLATPFTPCGDLWELTRYGRTFCEAQVRNCAGQIIAALSHIHSTCNLVHGDIKPHNFLLFMVDGRHVLQLCDFGLAERPGPSGALGFRGLRGTSGWFAPEMLDHRDYGQAVDIFGSGLVLFRMLAGYPPFDPPSHFSGEVEFDDRYWCHVSPACRPFMARVLALDPARRGTAEEAREHPWLAGPPPATPSVEQLRHLGAFGPLPEEGVLFWSADELPAPERGKCFASFEEFAARTAREA